MPGLHYRKFLQRDKREKLFVLDYHTILEEIAKIKMHMALLFKQNKFCLEFNFNVQLLLIRMFLVLPKTTRAPNVTFCFVCHYEALSDRLLKCESHINKNDF